MKRSKPLKDLLRSAINEAALSSAKLPPLDYTNISDRQEYDLKSRIADFKLLRNLGQFDQTKRAAFEDMLRAAGQTEDTVQAYANHYAMISREKAQASDARHTISRDIGEGIERLRGGIATFTKKLDR